MKILILEPFYTSFHIKLAKSLSDDISAFVFNYGNMVYLRGAKKVIVHKELEHITATEDDIAIAKETKTLYSETLRKIQGIEPSQSDFEYMAKYVGFLREYLTEHKIELVTMHNDLRWQHALAIKVCKELGVQYLITERGIFRPDTTTIEFEGVNGYSSLPKDKEFYKSYKIKEKELKSYKVSKITHLKVNVRFVLFILLNKFGGVLNLNTSVKNRGYSLVKYAQLFIKQKFSKKASQDIQLPAKYIFVPLQVNTDTQILIHSDFKNMQEFISLVEKEFYSLENYVSLVFKIHPMEKGIVEYKFDSRSVVVDSDTNELVKNSECVVTINSTVGFEAIEKHKKVLVLGEAFFKIDGIAVCSSKSSFKDDLSKVLNNSVKLDDEAIKSFVSYLKYEYQVNGSLFNWSNETFEEIKRKISKEQSKSLNPFDNLSESYRNFNKFVNTKYFLELFGLDIIDDYIYKDRLGGGQAGLTTIYANNDSKVVVKFLVAPRNDEEYQSFVSEYAALKKMQMQIQDFQAVPKIMIDFEQYQNMPIYYFGMEYIEAPTLKDFIKDKTPLSWEDTLNIIHRVAITLSELHVHSFVHRDLHPGNILITLDEEIEQHNRVLDTGVRILDLGNRSNWFEEMISFNKREEDKYRPKGAITSWSPEYLLNRGEIIGMEQDTWSLGIMFFYLLTGKYPIEANNISELIQKYTDKRFQIDWTLIPDDVPMPVVYLVQRALDFNQHTRIKTGPFTRVCYDIRFKDLLNWDKGYLKKYLKLDGQIDDPLDYIY